MSSRVARSANNSRIFVFVSLLMGLFPAAVRAQENSPSAPPTEAMKQKKVGDEISQEPVPVVAERRRPERKLPAQRPQHPYEELDRIELESGLVYYDIRIGTGDAPFPGCRVALKYVLWFPDGTTFDSSDKLGGSPAVLHLHKPEIILGWKEGIGSMRVGGVRRLEVPARLGYGEKGKYPIPPNQDMIFEVELLGVLEGKSEFDNTPKFGTAPGKPRVPTSVEGRESQQTPSGVKYWDLQVGKGKSPTADSRVRLRYTGWLTDGRMIETNEDSSLLLSYSLNQSIKGWAEGMATMQEGGKRRLEIPSALAFGEQGKPPLIPPSSDLIYEVELLGIEIETVPTDPGLIKNELYVDDFLTLTPVNDMEPEVSPSGLKYWDIKPGDGATPTLESEVSVRFVGWRKDGARFDGAQLQGKLGSFNGSAALKGWLEGVLSMKAGGRRRLEVPPTLGFQDSEPKSPVPPDSTLTFEIELLEVK